MILRSCRVYRDIGLELEEMSYADRLRYLDLFSVQGRLLRKDLITVWKIMHNLSPIPQGELFSLAPAVGTRGYSLKLASNHIRLEVRKRFFSQRVIRKWNSLSEATVGCKTLEGFKRSLAVDLGEQMFDFV